MATYDHIPVVVNDQQGSSSAAPGAIGFITCGGADAITSGKYATLDTAENHAASQAKVFVAGRAGYIKNLYVSCKTAPSSGHTYTVVVQKSTDNGGTYTDTALTCAVSGTGKAASDTANSVAIAAGDVLAVECTGSASNAADVCAITFEFHG